MNDEIMDAEKVKPRLEAICRNIIDEKKWKPFNDISIEVDDFPAVIGAHITLKDWKISIMASPELYPAVEQLRREEKFEIFFNQNDQEVFKKITKESAKESAKENTKRDITEIAEITTERIIEKILYAVVVHEYGHYRWCPSTQEGLQRILSGVYDAIHKREYKKERIEQLCFEIHNEVSDVILNTINARTDQQKEKYRDGLDLTYLLMSNYEKRKTKRRHGKEFELFLHANLLLSDTHPQMFEKIKKYGPWFFLGKERHIRKIIDAFTQNRVVTDAVLDHHVTPEQSQYIVDRFKNVSNWYQIAHDYARIIHPFLDEQNHWLENSYSRKNDPHKSGKSSGNNHGSNSSNKNSANPQQGKKDSRNDGKSEGSGSTKGDAKKSSGETKEGEDKQSNGRGKDESEDTAKNGKPQNGSPSSNTDPNHDQNSDSNHKKHRPHSLQDYLDQLADAISRKPYSSPFLRAYPRLNQLYEHRAGKIALFAEQENRSGMFHELYAGKEPLVLDDFTLRRVAWSETQMYEKTDQLDGELELELFQRSMPLRLEIESAMNPGGLPDFCFVVDSSSSMVFNPLKGEGSGDYHYAALGFYSILRYLKEINLAYELRYNMINFSMTTVASGWRPYSEIEEVKRTLFDYQGSWTNLDPEALQKMRETREDSVICFMLSDTQFAMDNEEEIIHEVDQMLATGDMGFYLFQIGGPTAFCRALEDRGIPPTYIRSAQDFMNLSIRFTKNLYGQELHK